MEACCTFELRKVAPSIDYTTLTGMASLFGKRVSGEGVGKIMDAIFSWFQRVEKVQFLAIEGRAITFKAKKAFKVGSRPTVSINIPIASGGAETFKLPVTISKVRQVGPKAVVCTAEVPGAAKSVEHLRQILNGLDPNQTLSDSGALDDSDSMRRAPRFNWSIRVLSKDLPGFRAVSLDFNRLGVKLSTEGPVEADRTIDMILEIETATTKELLCQGLVRWSKALGRRKYEVGVEFVELDEVVLRELENFEQFLLNRQSSDLSKKAIQAGFFEDNPFGPGVEGLVPPVPRKIPLDIPEEAPEENAEEDTEELVPGNDNSPEESS